MACVCRCASLTLKQRNAGAGLAKQQGRRDPSQPSSYDCHIHLQVAVERRECRQIRV
jgi:hypothetical protein